MPGPELHITFSESGAAELRKVFAALGETTRVIAPFDDLTYGPIRDISPRARIEWVEAVLGYVDADPDRWAQEIEAFWSDASSADDRAVVWMSGRVAKEMAGLMRLTTRLGGKPLSVIDLTEFRSEYGQRMPSLGLLSEGTLLRAKPWEHPRMLTDQECAQYVHDWKRLEAEDAPLRVLTDGRLTSAPITHFDDLLMSFATPDWRKMAYLVGFALGEDCETDVYQVGDLILASRARWLAEAGRLEWRGDLSEMRTTEVRLPSPPP